MPASHGRRARRLVTSLAAAATGHAAAGLLGTPAWATPAGVSDEATPCWSDQIAVDATPAEGTASRRAVILLFTLAGGAEPCTLAGYPGVDTGAGGPLVHAQPTPRGYLGGLPTGADMPPSVTLSLSTRGQAVVESMAVDGRGNRCPTYTELLVNPPHTTEVVTVPATIDACLLQVHPVTAG